jgi:hypothetical protein
MTRRVLPLSRLGAGRRPRTLAAVCASAVVAGGLTGVLAAGPASAANLTPLPVGPRPNATPVDFQAGARIAAIVDVGTGNLLVTTTELTLPAYEQNSG